MKSPLLLLSAIATAALLGACGKKSVAADPGPEPLAVVGGEKILPADLIAEISWRRKNDQFVPAPDKLLDEMVDRLATVQRAKKDGLDKDPDTKRRIETQLIASLRESKLDEQIRKIEISDADVEAAYKNNLDRYTRKAIDRFAILFVDADSKSSDQRRKEARGRLETARARAIENPAPGGRGPSASGFGILAVEFSEDQASRHRGGDIGWIEEGAANTRFPASVIAAGAKLEAGGISDIIGTDRGLYLIRKTDSRPGGVTPLTEISGELRQTLLRDRRNALEKSFIDETRAAANPHIDRAALSALELPSPARPPARPPDPADPADFPGVTSAPSR